MAKCINCGAGQAWPREQDLCIDCQARAAGKRSWTDAEDEVIETYFGLVLPGELQRRILKATGVPRSVNGVMVRAQRLNLDHRTNQDGVTVADAARELGVARWKLDRLVKSGELKTKGRGKVRLIELEVLERLRSLFPATPARSITKTQAMKRLGYSETHMTRLLQAGAIRGVRHGERWFVDADHVGLLVAEFKKTGQTRRDWGALPRLEVERAKCRDYARTRRREQRQLARKTTWCTQSEARRILGLGRDEMRRLLEQGVVRGRRENDCWLAERAHVDEIVAQRLAAERQGQVGA